METVYVLRIAKPRKDGTDKVTLKLVEDAEDAALVAERRARKADDESYTLLRYGAEAGNRVEIPGVSYTRGDEPEAEK